MGKNIKSMSFSKDADIFDFNISIFCRFMADWSLDT